MCITRSPSQSFYLKDGLSAECAQLQGNGEKIEIYLGNLFIVEVSSFIYRCSFFFSLRKRALFNGVKAYSAYLKHTFAAIQKNHKHI